MKPIKFSFSFLFLMLASKSFTAKSKCSKTCDLALASYYMLKGTNLTYTWDIMKSKVLSKQEYIVSYNTDTVPNKDSFIGDSRVNVPFPCDCINDEFLGHTFLYELQPRDAYASIAEFTFSNLTTKERIERDNVYAENSIPKFVRVNVTVNCSCGNKEVSKDYGLFITYPLRSEYTLESIASDTKLDAELLQRYNPGVDFSQGSGLVFIPGKDFGMTKLSDVASSTDNTDHVVGTFGYMPPENAYGHISRKIDVYAFGVVLYELISAKAAVVKIDKPSTEFELKSLEIKTNESIDEYKSLVALFDEVIDQDGDPIEGLRKLVDPRLGDNYSIDSIKKMTQLAKACINRDPKQRPTMRSVVVSLMTLNSTIDDGNRI